MKNGSVKVTIETSINGAYRSVGSREYFFDPDAEDKDESEASNIAEAIESSLRSVGFTNLGVRQLLAMSLAKLSEWAGEDDARSIALMEAVDAFLNSPEPPEAGA